jgi:hypothetical protein
MNHLGDLFKQVVVPEVQKPEGRKRAPSTEYEAIALEMTSTFTKREHSQVWALMWNVKYSLNNIRDAWFALQRSKVKTFRYYMGILNKLQGIKK